jgi:hypothetical protein
MKPVAPKPQRCAIYTRKSTEHNLDLAFNSLDAQREACEAYIKSQAHEGWRLVQRGAMFDDARHAENPFGSNPPNSDRIEYLIKDIIRKSDALR